MRICLFTLCLFVFYFSFAQNVGIGTTTPQSKLHVMGAGGGTAILVEEPVLTNSAAVLLSLFSTQTDLTRYGPSSSGLVAGIPSASLTRLYTPVGDLMMATGGPYDQYFVTNSLERMRLTGSGELGLGATFPLFKFHVQTATGEAGIGIQNDAAAGYSLLSLGYGTRSSGNAISLLKFGPSAAGNSFGLPKANLSVMASDAGSSSLVVGTNNSSSLYLATNQAVRMEIRNNGNTAIGIEANDFAKFHVRRSGSITYVPGGTIGAIYGENGSDVDGSGVYGITGSSRTGTIGYAGVTGHNLSTGTEKFGVIGHSTGTSSGSLYSAGVGGYGDNGVVGSSATATGAGVVAQHTTGKTALEVNNGFIKVSGTNKSAFKHTTAAGNTSGNVTVLTYDSPGPNDIVLITHNYSPNNTYHNKATGVFWNGGTWAIYNEDISTMPMNITFNVLVIKQ